MAVDASAYFSRPGPRLVTGIELLAHILHPDRLDSPGHGMSVEIGDLLPTSLPRGRDV